MRTLFDSVLCLLLLFSWDVGDHEWHGFFDHGCGLCLIEGNDCGECEQPDLCAGLCLR